MNLKKIKVRYLFLVENRFRNHFLTIHLDFNQATTLCVAAFRIPLFLYFSVYIHFPEQGKQQLSLRTGRPRGWPARLCCDASNILYKTSECLFSMFLAEKSIIVDIKKLINWNNEIKMINDYEWIKAFRAKISGKI